MKLKLSDMFTAANWLKLSHTVFSGHDSRLLAGQVWNAQV